ncbi:MAG: hypothetical protein AB8B53_14050 [Flavobacteriales bacterium]
MQYPIYLQFSATNTWYHILNDHTFIEVKTLGNTYSASKYSDDILPMRNHISDLIVHDGTKSISEQEFNDYLAKLKSEKSLRDF